jgi:hypothetical protein
LRDLLAAVDTRNTRHKAKVISVGCFCWVVLLLLRIREQETLTPNWDSRKSADCNISRGMQGVAWHCDF